MRSAFFSYGRQQKKLLSVFLSCFKVEALYWGSNKKTKEEHDGQLSNDI